MKVENVVSRRGLSVLMSTALGLFLICGAGAQTSAPSTATSTAGQLPPLIRSVRGADVFRAYCASCHGLDAKGNGPAAASLKTKVADLTVLAKKNAGKFPDARVRKVIMGDDVVASHGSREMPIWGPIFHQVEEDVDRGNVRLDNLVKYLELIQIPN